MSSAFLRLMSPHSAVSVTLLPGTVYNVAAGWSDSPSVHPMNSQSPPRESVPSDGSAICSPSLADIGAGTLPAVAPPPANDTVHVFMSHFAESESPFFGIGVSAVAVSPSELVQQTKSLVSQTGVGRGPMASPIFMRRDVGLTVAPSPGSNVTSAVSVEVDSHVTQSTAITAAFLTAVVGIRLAEPTAFHAILCCPGVSISISTCENSLLSAPAIVAYSTLSTLTEIRSSSVVLRMSILRTSFHQKLILPGPLTSTKNPPA